jgi:hypothetical protein
VDNDFGYGRLDVLAAYQWLAVTPDFTVSVSPASATTPAGGAASYDVTVEGVNGFTGEVSLSLAGLSGSQAAWSFEPPVLPGGSGTARLTVTTAAAITPGTYPLTITGVSDSTTRTGAANLIVAPPPEFTLDATPSSQTVDAGGGAAYTVSVGSLNGFTGDVALSLTGLPPSVGSAAFVPASVPAAGTSQLTIGTSATAPAGSYPLTITGTSGSLTHSAAVTLVVTVRDFTLSASPSSVTISRGQTASYTVSVSPVGSFTGSVSLSVTGAPPGSLISFTTPVAAPGTSTLRVRTTASTTRGMFTLWITGTNGSLVHQATVTLIVR